MGLLPQKRNKVTYGLFIYLFVFVLGWLSSGSEAATLMSFVPSVTQETTLLGETRLEENESLDKTDFPRKVSLEQFLPRRIQNHIQAPCTIELPGLNFRPKNPFTCKIIGTAVLPKSSTNLPRWLILQTLLI